MIIFYMKKVIFTEKAPKPLARYSQGIRVGNFIFISGQVPINPATGEIVGEDIKTQVIQVINNIKSILESEGASLKDIVKVTVFLSDISLYKEFNEIYNDFFKENPPARTTVEAKLPSEKILIEMDAIAYID